MDVVRIGINIGVRVVQIGASIAGIGVRIVGVVVRMGMNIVIVVVVRMGVRNGDNYEKMKAIAVLQ